MDNIFKIIVGVGGAIVSYLLGGWSPLVQILVLFIAIDYALGVIVAFSFGKLNSKIGFRRIAKKVAILVLVAVAYSLDKIMGDGTFMRDAVIFFYLANELISILETVAKTDLPVPNILRKAVETLNNKSEGND